MVYLYLKNEQKNSREIIFESLSNTKIFNKIEMVEFENVADMVIDCGELKDKEQFKAARKTIVIRLWEINKSKINKNKKNG
jgi:hypothetical protein